MNIKHFLVTAIWLLFVLSGSLKAQVIPSGTRSNGSQESNIITAVPFLLISPDARTGGMGEAAVAVLPDGNSASNNPSKLAFLDQRYGLSLSYSPWLRSLVSDVNLGYLSGFYKLDERNAVGGSIRYFSYGRIELTDANQQSMGTYSPNEFAIDATFSRRFGDSFSLGTSLRYIRSGLFAGQNNGTQIKAGRSVALDVSAYFRKESHFFGSDAILGAGAVISNLGTKMGYTDADRKYFLPTNLRIGGASTFLLDALSQLTFAIDFNKLLVPTQPVYDQDGRILEGKNPDVSVPAGLFASFGDAPGGFSEELKEISIATGLEYLYNHKFALRGGYFYENPQKGNRRYFTLGAGFKYDVLNIDLAYLIASPQKSPMANTLRFTLLFNFGQGANK